MLSPWSLLRRWRQKPLADDSAARRAKVLLVVEGAHDVEFLRRISRILHAYDRRLPDLASMESANELIFVPFGGGDVLGWSNRLAALGLPEAHIYDRETQPHTAVRDAAAAVVNRRSNCRAFVTNKRALENYLSPAMLLECRGIVYGFDMSRPPWSELPRRARRRFRERAKTWLNRDAVSRMTPGRLAERDLGGEVADWLTTISFLASHA